MNPETDNPTTSSGQPTPSEARRTKSLEELIAEQGVAETATYKKLLGAGADLWADDAEFDAFMKHLRAIGKEKD
jgi:hypothetical protein